MCNAYFDYNARIDHLHDELAQEIANYLIKEGTENTSNGSWVVYFNEIEDEFDVDVDQELVNRVVDSLNPEIVADVIADDFGFDMIFYLDYCPNIEEAIRREVEEFSLKNTTGEDE